MTSGVYFTDPIREYNMGAHLGSSIKRGSTVTKWNSFIDSSFRFLDKETNIELEISKLISEQEKNKSVEIPNYDEVDEEIARLIQSFEEEEKQRREQGKPSLIACASPLMSFLLEDSEEENIVSTDLISQAMKGDKFRSQ